MDAQGMYLSQLSEIAKLCLCADNQSRSKDVNTNGLLEEPSLFETNWHTLRGEGNCCIQFYKI